MIADYCFTLPKHMWRYGNNQCTGNKKWRLYTLLHLPAFAVNLIVIVNHLHRDQIVALKLLHPVLVFIGSIATFYGSFAVSKAETEYPRKQWENATGRDWDMQYTLSSILVGAVLAYGSLYLTV